jgi:hypothetical protein
MESDAKVDITGSLQVERGTPVLKSDSKIGLRDIRSSKRQQPT